MRVDIHIHSVYSRDAIPTPREIIQFAKKKGLSGVAITDHNSVEGGRIGRKLDPKFVIPGIEIRTREGDVLGLGLTKLIPKGMSVEETVERIREEGGVAVAAHPYARLRAGVGDLVKRVDFDAIEVLNAHLLSRNPKALKVCQELGKSMCAGSDAHVLEDVGNAYTEAEASSLEEFLECLRKGKTKVFGTLPSLWGEIRSMMKRRVAKIKRFLAGPAVA
ncbi:MAG: PHP domain-containing protein [Candidatus Hadarchaeales archaeon]